MRPPEFTGGNGNIQPSFPLHGSRFNEAAGIHRRKLERPGAGQLA